MKRIYFMICLLCSAGFLLSCDSISKKASSKKESTARSIARWPGLQQSQNSGTIIAKLNFEMVKVPAGSFTMGSPENEKYRDTDEAQVKVTISQPFEIMRAELTQSQWYFVMRNNPSRFKKPKHCANHKIVAGVGMCPDHPVERVSWNDVQGFITTLNSLKGLRGCRGGSKDPRGCYRLPTEAEWEYSARAGTKTAYYFGNDGSSLWNYAVYRGNSGGRTHKVKSKAPNAFGLYDVSGNVWEWVQDAHYKRLLGGVDPLVTRGSGRVLRGGGWGNYARYLQSANRGRFIPEYGYHVAGFRLVRTL